MKDIEKCSSDELKGAIQMRSAELPEGGSQETHDNIGYVYDEPDAEEELEEGEERVEAFEPEEVDPVVEYLEKFNKEKLESMNVQSKSFYKKALQQQSQQDAAEAFHDFSEDAEELQAKYSAHPELLQKFASDYRFNRVPPLSKEEASESECPQELLLIKWINKQKGISSAEIKEILATYHGGPRLGSRFRDRVLGYNQSERKMSDSEINERIKTLFDSE